MSVCDKVELRRIIFEPIGTIRIHVPKAIVAAAKNTTEMRKLLFSLGFRFCSHSSLIESTIKIATEYFPARK